MTGAPRRLCSPDLDRFDCVTSVATVPVGRTMRLVIARWLVLLCAFLFHAAAIHGLCKFPVYIPTDHVLAEVMLAC